MSDRGEYGTPKTVSSWRARTWQWLKTWLLEQFAPRQTIAVQRRPRVASSPRVDAAPSRARTKQRRPRPVPPSLVESPDSDIVRPWEGGGTTSSIELDEIRPVLIERLYEEVDACTDDDDRAFVTRLIRNLSTDRLDLPPFPDVAWRLDTLLRLADPPLIRVVKIVRREPALVRRVWTQACSAYYARPPNSLDHAVARIGFDALWRIGMSTCLYSEVFRVRGFQEDADAVRRHGIVVADVAAWLSGKKLGSVYLAGLLHDVGKLIIYRAASGRPNQALPSSEIVDRLATEHHATIGVLVAHDWKLGEEVAACIGYHHDPFQAPLAFHRSTVQVQVANIATHTAELSRQGNDCGGLLTLLHLEGLDFDVGRTIGKAHEIFEGLETQPDAAQQPVLDVVE